MWNSLHGWLLRRSHVARKQFKRLTKLEIQHLEDRLTPAVLYVDDAWAALANGAAVGDADPVTSGNQPATIGTTAFATIAAAITASTTPASDTIVINDGTYSAAVNLGTSARSIRLTNGTAIVSGIVSGSGALSLTSTDTIASTLQFTSVAHTFTSAITVGSGVRLRGDGAAGFGAGTKTVTVQSGGQAYLVGAGTVPNTITFNIAGNAWANGDSAATPYGALRIDVGGVVAGPVVLSAGAGIGVGSDAAATGTITGVVSGTGFSVTKNGPGILNLNAANTFNGGTIISNGTLRTNNATGAGAAAGTVTLGDSNTAANNVAFLASVNSLNFAQNFVVSAQGTGTATVGTADGITGTVNTQWNGTFTLNRSITLRAGSADRTTFSGLFSGAGGVIITGSAAANRINLIGTGTNSFAGPLNVQSGSLQVGGTSTFTNQFIPDSATVTVASGATLRFSTSTSGGNETIAVLTGSGTITQTEGAGAFSLSVGSGDTSSTFSGTFGSSVSATSARLTKIGNGTLTLTSTGTGAWNSTVSGGTMLLSNTTGSALGTGAVTVAAGGTVGGTGSTTGAITVSGTLFSPALFDNLTVGNLSFTAGVQFAPAVAGTTPGTNLDRLNVVGSVNLTNATLNPSFTTTFSVGTRITLISNDGFDLVTGQFAGLAEGDSVVFGGQNLSVSYAGGDGNDVVLTRIPDSFVYVNDDWSTFNPDDLILDADPVANGFQNATFATTAFASVASAQASSAVAGGAGIIVNAGTYAEAVVLPAAAYMRAQEGLVVFDSLSSVAEANVLLAAGATLRVNAAGGDSTFTGTLTGPGTLEKVGAGTLTLAATLLHAGPTTLSVGTVDVRASVDFTWPSLISGAGSLTKSGASAVTLTAANIYAGATTIDSGTLRANGTLYNVGATAGAIIVNNGGTLAIGRNDILGNAATTTAVTLTVNAGGLVTSNGFYTTFPVVFLNGGEIRANGGVSNDYPAYQLRSVTVGGTTPSSLTGTAAGFSNFGLNQLSGRTTTFDIGDVTGNSNPDLIVTTAGLTNGVGGAANIIKSGSGTLSISNAATSYSGTTTVNAGTLRFNNTGTALVTSTIINNSSVVFSADSNNLTQVPSTLTGAGTFTVEGPGGGTAFQNRVILQGTTVAASTNTGTIQVASNAKLWFDRARNIIGDSATVNIAPSGTFFVYSDATAANQVNETIGGLTGSGTVSGWLGGGTIQPALRVGGGDVSSSFAGSIIDQNGSVLNLFKVGTGTLTLSGASTFAGPTTISAGTLLVNNTTGSGLGTGAVTVAAGATLGGTGRLTGAVTATGAIAPGNGGTTTAILGVGNVSFATGGSLVVDVATPIAGSGHDRLAVTGTVNLTNSTLTLNVTGLVPPAGTLIIVSNDGTDAVTGTFTGLAEGATVTASDGQTFTISYVGGDGNDVVLTRTITSAVYVDDAWTALTVGESITDADPVAAGDQGRTFGTDAFATVNEALASPAVIGGENLIINAGTYAELVAFDILRAATLQQGPVRFDGLSGTNAGAALVIASGATLTVAQSTAATFAGSLSGAGSLIKEGSATLTLAGTEDISGTFTATEGTLDLAGGSFTVGGLLGTAAVANGTLIVGGAVTVATNGTTGILTTPNLQLLPATVLAIDINGTTAGTDHDQLSVTGTVNLGNARLEVVTGPSLRLGDRFIVVSNDGTDPIVSTGLNGNQFRSNNSSPYLLTLNAAGGDGNDLELAVTGLRINVDEDAAPQTISLASLLAGPGVTYTITQTNTSGLLTPVVSGTDLTLTFAPNAYGFSYLRVTASNGTQTVTGIIEVLVRPVDDNVIDVVTLVGPSAAPITINVAANDGAADLNRLAEAANINVVQNDAANNATSVTVTTPERTADFFLGGSNRGDFDIRIGTSQADDVAGGVLFSTIRENGRDNNAKGDTAGVQ